MNPSLESGYTVDVAAIIAEAARSGARPEANLLVSEWADQHRILTTRSSSEPGPWRTSRTPYLKEPMDCLSTKDRTEMVVLMTGSQVGKTETGNNWIGFVIDQAPGPMLAVQPTTEMAKRNSKQRVATLIEESPALRAKVKESRSRDAGNTILAKEFPGGILVMVGANSAKGLRSMPARYLFLDEVDGYPGDVEGEGEPCELAIARTSTFSGRSKVLITSTPVVSGRSRVEAFFEKSDQCFYYVPCPFCIEMQTLRLENLRWPKRDPAAAHYVCEACGKSIPNHAKNWMLPRGEWRASALAEGRIRGFHLSSLYSPVGWLSWGQIAAKHEAAIDDPTKLQVFWNTVLGLPWSDRGEVPESDRLYERRENYPIGLVPYGGLALTAGADVQPRRIEVEVVAWGRAKQSWSVDYRVLEGDTSQPAVWDKLGAMLEEDFPTVYGQPVRILRLAVDTAFNTTAAYEFVRKMNTARVMGIKGDSRASAFVQQPSFVEVGPQGQRLKHGVRLWSLNVGIGKETLYRWLRSSVPDVSMGEAWPVGFCHFPEYSKEYFEQLTAEQLVTKTGKNGYRKTEWQKRRDRNEALDVRIYAMAAANSLRTEIWSAEKWDDIEAQLTLEKAPPLPPAQRGQPIGPPPKFKSFGPKQEID
jgi:phage terminase large subunit GpA-like protein